MTATGDKSSAPKQGEAPNGWGWTTFGTIADIRLGKMLSPKAYEHNLVQLPYLRNQNIRWGSIDFANVKRMGFRKEEVERYELLPGDLLVCEGGAAGRCAVYTGSPSEFMYQKALHRVRPKDGVANSSFLQFCLQHYVASGTVIPRLSETTIQHLPLEKIRELKILLPPVAEQRRIVAEIEKQFTRLDVAIEGLKRVRANLQRCRASVLKAACEGRLVPTEAELARAEGREYAAADVLLQRILKARRAKREAAGLAKMTGKVKAAKHSTATSPAVDSLPALPDGWTWASVEQLAALSPNSVSDGPFGSNLKTAHYTESGPRVIRLQNIGDGVFVDEHAHISSQHFASLSKHRVHAGDLVIAAMGERPPRACVVPSSVGPAIVKADCVRFKPNDELALSAYLSCALNSDGTRSRTATIVHGVGRPRLNLAEIKSVALPLPPLDEQRRIVGEVERRLSVIEEIKVLVEANLKRAARLRQSILKRAFEGALVPQDPNDEPASVLLERLRAERKVTGERAASRERGTRTKKKQP